MMMGQREAHCDILGDFMILMTKRNYSRADSVRAEIIFNTFGYDGFPSDEFHY